MKRQMANIMFGSRWLQAPLYLGLIIAQAVYVLQFLRKLAKLVSDFWHQDVLQANQVMLAALGLIDVVMISNLLIMVVIGGYETFVSRLEIHNHPDKPEWLGHVNSNVLKGKLILALISVSSIHLLQTFIESDHINGQVIIWQIAIHVAFLLSAITVAFVDYLAVITQQKQSNT